MLIRENLKVQVESLKLKVETISISKTFNSGGLVRTGKPKLTNERHGNNGRN